MENECITLDLSLTGDLEKKADEHLAAARECLISLRKKSCAGSDMTGWMDWPRLQGFKLCSEIETWKHGITCSWDSVVVCGIGGSFAGVRAVESALSHAWLGHSESARRNTGLKPILYCGHNLSEKNLAELLHFLDEKSPILCVISKSGTTTEPGAAFRVMQQYMSARYGSRAADRIVAVTDAESGGLRALAQEHKFTTFPVPGDTGGRFSILSAVGLVPLILAGYQVRELLGGADSFYQSLEKAEGIPENGKTAHPVLRLAAFRKAAFDRGCRLDILSCSEPGLAAFTEWWKQLFGESEGKDNKGLFPAGLQYPADLHSLGQFLQEGTLCMMETFLEARNFSSGPGVSEERIRVPHVPGGNHDGLNYLEGFYLDEINRAAMKAGMLAHSSRGIPCIKITYPQTDLRNLGVLFAFFQTTCAVSALLLNLNPFDQPGVEAYKQEMFRILGRPGYELGAAARTT